MSGPAARAMLVAAACLLLLFSTTVAGAQPADGVKAAQSPRDAKPVRSTSGKSGAQKAKAAPKAGNPRKAASSSKARAVDKAGSARNRNAAPARNAQSREGEQKARNAPGTGNPTGSAAQAVPATAAGAAQAEMGPPPEYRLGPGDAIRVLVYQNPDLTVEARVSERGSISFPLIGAVNVGKLSIGQAEQRIANELRTRKMLRAPHVNIVLLQVRGSQVSVLGEVHRPGRFALDTVNVRVSDMVAAAGGITPAGDDLLVLSGTRGGKPFSKTIDVPALFANTRSPDDVILQAGDTLYVHRAPVFYIYGEAQRPGPYRIERGMTVMQALAQGGGPTPRGNPNRLRLTRKQSDGAVVQSTAQLTDRVQAGDVLFVHESIF